MIGISNQSAGVVVPSLFSVSVLSNLVYLTSSGSGPLPPVSPQICTEVSTAGVPVLMDLIAIFTMLSDVGTNGIACHSESKLSAASGVVVSLTETPGLK
uniref:Uncharacterized protein n=1 Tax=uncultured marine virus TaxID=186617 RepID=A0A0F7L8J4_9VIRU|nr:hypothetical protein [uncultured marine virus]